MQRTEEIIKDCTQADLRGLLRQQFQDMRDYAGLYEIITSPNFESNVLRMIISMILEKADEETKKNMLADARRDVRRRWDCYYCPPVVLRLCLREISRFSLQVQVYSPDVSKLLIKYFQAVKSSWPVGEHHVWKEPGLRLWRASFTDMY